MNEGQQSHEQQQPPQFQAPRMDIDDMMGAQYAPGQWQNPDAQLKGNVEKFMGIVYAWMGGAVAVTALTVLLINMSPSLVRTLWGFDVATGMQVAPPGPGYLLLFAPLPFVWIFGSRISGMQSTTAGILLMVYAALIGGAISYIGFAYNTGSIAGCLFVATAMFAAMSAFGYFTKKDLSGVGRFLMMAATGLFFAWLAHFIWPQIYFWVAAIGVFVFAGLTAYDTQNIKQMYLVHGGRGNLAIVGALSLYISLVNMFLFLLHLFGGRD